MSDPRVRATIAERLNRLETSEGARVLYACESGSRAWGFESTDSDFDVRFIYVRPRDWYLSIELEDRRDVIELPIEDDLDINGWDLRKALRLLRRSNPPLLEWLGSPIVYREASSAAERMRHLAKHHHSPTACAYHYLHMAQRNFKDYLRGPSVWRKKYLYVLRPLLAVRWIERGLGMVPMRFEELVRAVIEDRDLEAAVRQLVEEKVQGKELDRGPRIEGISLFVEAELERLDATPLARKPAPPPAEPFDEAFRTLLIEAWAA